MNNYLLVDMYIKESRQQFLNNARRYHEAISVDNTRKKVRSFLSIFMCLNKTR